MRQLWLWRMGALLGLVAVWCPGIMAETHTRRMEVDFVLRRAAFELSIGDPRRATDVLQDLDPNPETDSREALASLVWAQSLILSGRFGAARPQLLRLVEAPNKFVRAQAAAHLLALQSVSPDSNNPGILEMWNVQREHYRRGEFNDAAAGQLLASELLRMNPVAQAQAWRRIRKGPAAVVAKILLAESAMDSGDYPSAESQFAQLAKKRDDPFAGWSKDWAYLGQARALLQLDREKEAISALKRINKTQHLVQYAQWMQAQIAWSNEDLKKTASILASLQLSQWNFVMAAEAKLLAAQVEMEQGNWAVAESLSNRLQQELPLMFRQGERSRIFGRSLQIDVDAWHASRTRATLQYMKDRGLLRRVPRSQSLAEYNSAILLVGPQVADSSSTRLTLIEPYRHEDVQYPSEEDSKRAETRARASLARLEQLRGEAAHVLRQLEARKLLAIKAQKLLDSHHLALDELDVETAALLAALREYRLHLKSQENAWQQAVGLRLKTLGETLSELRHAVVRLEARYPDDRTIRQHEAIDNARETLPAIRAWVTDLEVLRQELQGKHENRVHLILSELEPAAVAKTLGDLRADILSLQSRTADLDLRFQSLDGTKQRQYDQLQLELAAARSLFDRQRYQADSLASHLAQQQEWRLQARYAAYTQAAADVRATAAFLAALSDSSLQDSRRLAGLQHAVDLLTLFVTEHPQAPRAAEQLYRLGETHLQRASIQYRVDLARYLEAGGEVDEAPLPVESYADAIEAFELLLHSQAQSARRGDAHFQLGYLYAEINAIEISNGHLNEYLTSASVKDSRRGAAALRLGDNYLILKDWQAAFTTFEMASKSSEPEQRDLGLFKLGWTAYELDRLDEAREAFHRLLEYAGQSTDEKSHARELRPETLELLALTFAQDHAVFEAAEVLDEWGQPPYDFVLLRRMAQVFAHRALYEEAIAAYQIIFERHPLHPEVAGAVDTWVHLVHRHQGEGAAHQLAADLANHFAPGGDWSRGVDVVASQELEQSQPSWQSRLIEEDVAALRADSLSRALSRPDLAAQRMGKRLRAAAVYEHRRATKDTLHELEHYAKAVLMYAQTLEAFPDREDEAQTWLYLGEAHYALGRYEDAADAYVKAAAGAGIDTTLVLQAQGQELVALDTATAARPEWYLERYYQSANHFSATYSQDPRGWEALERVGELAFKSEAYEQSEIAYMRFAEGSGDRKRTTWALKFVGDTYYKRQKFTESARRYEIALQHAQASRQDSLVYQLKVLVPGTWFRAAEIAEKSGDPRQAAQGFERLAASYASFEFADQAWYRAAALRTTQGDTLRAQADYDELLQKHPESDLIADAMLNLGSLQEGQRAHASAATTYLQFASKFPGHDQAIKAKLRAAELFQSANRLAEADALYEDLLLGEVHGQSVAQDTSLVVDLWLRRARMNQKAGAAAHYEQALKYADRLTPVDRAEARFYGAEQHQQAYEAIQLRQPIAKSLNKKKIALEKLLSGYASTIAENIEPWHGAAALRVGESLIHFGSSLRKSEAPTSLKGEDLWAYRETLSEQAQGLEDRAVGAWSDGLKAAQLAKHQDDWTHKLQDSLYPLLAQRVTTLPTPLFVLVRPKNKP